MNAQHHNTTNHGRTRAAAAAALIAANGAASSCTNAPHYDAHAQVNVSDTTPTAPQTTPTDAPAPTPPAR